MIVLLVLCCLGSVGGGTLYYINNSPFYQMALDAVQESPRARDVLGTPIEGGWVITQFQVETNNGNGTARIEVPVSGPNASGTVYVGASFQNGGDWHLDSAELEVDGGRFSLGQ